LSSHVNDILSSTGCLVSLSQIFRISSVLLTYYAVYIARSGWEGNFIGGLLGVIPFTLIGTVVFVSATVFSVKYYTGRLRLELLSLICVLAALDFLNDFAAVFLRVQLLPV
jgi:hypothetical protein